MAYRTFLDENGHYWQVWDSHPQGSDRRRSSERRKNNQPWTGPERRLRPERRVAIIPRSSTLVNSALANGWLTFESFAEKRRLAPVPLYWDEIPTNELIALWKRANRVVRNSEQTGAA